MTEANLQPMSDPQIACVVEGDGGWRIVLRGEIDLNTDPQLDAALATVTAVDPARILVELAEVTFLASTGLGFLAQLRTHAALAGHAVTLHGPNHTVRRALTLMGFDEVFTITTA